MSKNKPYFYVLGCCIVALGLTAADKATEPPKITDAQLSRYWHAVAVRISAQSQADNAQKEVDAAISDLRATCTHADKDLGQGPDNQPICIDKLKPAEKK